MRYKTGFKTNDAIQQYFTDDNVPTPFFYILSGSVVFNGITYGLTSTSSMSSGRFYECFYNTVNQAGPSNPYLFNHAIGDIYTLTLSGSIYSYIDAPSLTPGTTIYQSSSLTPIPASANPYYIYNNYWYQLNTGTIINYGLLNNITYYFSRTFFTGSAKVGLSGSNVSMSYNISPNTSLSFSAKANDALNNLSNQPTNSLQRYVIMRNGLTIYDSTASFTPVIVSQSTDIYQISYYLFAPGPIG